MVTTVITSPSAFSVLVFKGDFKGDFEGKGPSVVILAGLASVTAGLIGLRTDPATERQVSSPSTLLSATSFPCSSVSLSSICSSSKTVIAVSTPASTPATTSSATLTLISLRSAGVISSPLVSNGTSPEVALELDPALALALLSLALSASALATAASLASSLSFSACIIAFLETLMVCQSGGISYFLSFLKTAIICSMVLC
mmetsp:Transcript_34476/g.32848  ORF Transcript_34476/g.32848 Transcript_34476/m.32848 type:complete len:201 (+) Transcript_34476:434-1036(+)